MGLDRLDILQDVLENPVGSYPPAEVLDKIIKKLPSTTWYPVYKYLREAGHLKKNGEVRDRTALPSRILARFDHLNSEMKLSIKGVDRVTMDELAKTRDPAWIFTHALDMLAYTHDVAGLRSYLIANLPRYRTNGWWAAQYVKAVISYERLRYATK